MRFIPAKCPNCGAKIKMKKGEHIYTCEYCKFDIIFDDNNQFDTESMNLSGIDLSKFYKINPIWFFVPFIILFIIIASIIFFIVIDSFNNESIKDESIEIIDKIESDLTNEKDSNKEQIDKQDVQDKNDDNKKETIKVSPDFFNILIDSNAYENGFSVSNKLNYVVDNINSYNKLITIVYKNEEFTSVEKIKELATNIGKDKFKEYSVDTNKDKYGYINKIIINAK